MQQQISTEINILGLSKDDEKRLEDIYTHIYCKSETNNLKLNEFIMFILDREFLNCKFNLMYYYKLHNEYVQLPEEITITVNKNQKKVVQDEVKRLSKNKFFKLIQHLGKTLYSGSKYMPMILNDIFQDNKKKNEIRTMIYDEINKKIISDSIVKLLLDYQEDLQALFTQYQPENYQKNDQMLTWQEIKLMNLNMPISSFIHLLYDAQLFPQSLSADNIEDILMRVIPASNAKQNQFYQANYIATFCDQILNQKFKQKNIDGDPCITFFEFQVLMARIGIELFGKNNKSDQAIKDVTIPILTLFEFLQIDKNTQHKPKEISKLTQIIAKYYQSRNPVDLVKKEKKSKAPEEIIPDANLLILTRQPEQLNYRDLYQFFQTTLPPLPVLKTQKQLCQDFVESIKERDRKIELKKKQEEDKKNKNKPAAKPQPKKGEQQARVFSWESMNPPPKPCSYQYFLDFIQVNQQVNHNRDVNQLKTLSHITTAPILLPEALYPIEPPQNSIQYVEAAIAYFMEQNYYQSFLNLNKAQEEWVQFKEAELNDAEQVFFEYFQGQIYEIAGQDTAALNKFLRVKSHTDKLNQANPDKALQFDILNRPYCGFGSVLYHMEEYELAARSFLQAKSIRESIMGDANIENGLTLNNLGCCFHQMKEFFQAETLYTFAIAIFNLHLGPFHEMTLTSKQNLSKVKQNKCQRPDK